MSNAGSDTAAPAWQAFLRTAEFWARVTSIYGSFKVAQVKAHVLQHCCGRTPEQVKEEVWEPQHAQAGRRMYQLCIDLRGFYLKTGQFIGSRGDFVPAPICQELSKLCDQVPPMPAHEAEAALKRELQVDDLGAVFEWINLDKPLGSASISQVHKARLRNPTAEQLAAARDALRLKGRDAGSHAAPVVTLATGQSAWDVCNSCAIGLAELQRLNPGQDLDRMQPGAQLVVPPWSSLEQPGSSGSSSSSSSAAGRSSSHGQASSSSSGGSAPNGERRGGAAAAAVVHAIASQSVAASGLVAVKIQYPDAMDKMALDLQNIRAAAFYLSKTEIPFDLVSAVDELSKQIRLEFDFVREARVMDRIAHHLRDISARVQVPRSVPGLVTRRLLVMEFVDGIPLLSLGERTSHLSALQRKLAKRRILSRVAEAYGRMILGEGLFQADGHPGNILVCKGAKIGLLDYGQSKQITREQRLGMARLILELHRGDLQRISDALHNVGIVTDKQDLALRSRLVYGMFDTRGTVNPFDPDSPIKKCAITTFPPDLFFVLRVVQLLRGMANGMGISDFSSASQWAPLARAALAESGSGRMQGNWLGWTRFLMPWRGA